MVSLQKDQAVWVHDMYRKMLKKELAVIRRNPGIIPYSTEGDRFDNMLLQDPSWWTNGFWPGILWRLYLETQEEALRTEACKLERGMDDVLADCGKLHHDVGFMWIFLSVANWRVTRNERSRVRGLTAANHLASRFNPDAGFITAWNPNEQEGFSIIDTMMNLPLLYWASQESGFGRYKKIALRHADQTLANHLRPDGSVAHIVEYDLDNGHVLETYAGQGYAAGSSWSRGQAWAIYGFTLSWSYSGDQRYLDAAKQTAHYFLAAARQTGYVPPIDFRSPEKPFYSDASAAAIAACGLIELAKALGETPEGRLYLNGALCLLNALDGAFTDWTLESDALLHGCSEAYPPRRVHIDLIYGDYFLIEALCKLCGNDLNLW